YRHLVPHEPKSHAALPGHNLGGGGGPPPPPARPPPPLSENEREALSFPALPWLDRTLAKLSTQTSKILADMPVHVAAQPWPGTRAAAIEAECKARIAAVARRHAAQLIDWRIGSPLTTNDENYWDPLHYRLPIGERIASELIAAALEGRPSADGSYRIVVP